jgi:ATP-dependent Clp protease ATP-binding subunit ClpX
MLRITMRCSFCGRRDSEVEKLVAGPRRIFGGRVYICDRCATQTIHIMEAHSGPAGPPSVAPTSSTGS